MNIAEKLKEVPKGFKLYSPVFGEVTFITITEDYIIVKDCLGIERSFYFNGNFCNKGECVLFPSKNNKNWNDFSICPFKDGDVVSKTYPDGTKFIAIFSHAGREFSPIVVNYHCYVRDDGRIKIAKDFGIGVYTEYKLASEKEREFLFKSLTENGYYWDTCTKSVKTLHLKFKVGDTIYKKSHLSHTIVAIEEDRYRMKNGFFLMFTDQHEWEKEIRKFDINTLKPFDKVLARNGSSYKWTANFFSHLKDTGSKFICSTTVYQECIPYNEETKHLLGTNKECSEYYKTWE